MGNKNMILTKDSEAGLLAMKDQNDAQAFISQFNLYYQENK